MDTLSQKPRLWTRDFIWLCITSLMVSGTMTMFNSTVALYVKSLGGLASFSGEVTLAFTIAAIIFRFIGGHLSDHKGRIRIIIAGAVIMCLSSAAYRIFPSLTAVLILRALQGVGFSMFTTAAAAAASDVIPQKRITEGLGFFGLTPILSMAYGPIVGMSFIGSNNYTGLFYFAGIMLFLTTVLSSFINYEKREDNKAALEEKRAHVEARRAQDALTPEKNIFLKIFEKTAILPSLVQLMAGAGYAAVLTFLTLYATSKGYSGSVIGLFYTLAAAATLLVRVTTSGIVNKMSTPVLYGLTCVFGIAGIITLAFTSTPLLFLISGALYGVGFGITTPTLMTASLRKAPVHRRGAASATFYVALDAGIGLGAMVWGVAIDVLGFTNMFLGACGVLVLSGLLCAFTLNEKRNPKEAE